MRAKRRAALARLPLAHLSGISYHVYYDDRENDESGELWSYEAFHPPVNRAISNRHARRKSRRVRRLHRKRR